MGCLARFCYEMYKERQLLDLTFRCEGGTELQAHGLVVASQSQLVRSTLVAFDAPPTTATVFQCDRVAPPALKALIRYAYTNAFEEDDNPVPLEELLTAAQLMEMSEAVKHLEKKLQQRERRQKEKACPTEAVEVTEPAPDSRLSCASCKKTFRTSRQWRSHRCLLGAEKASGKRGVEGGAEVKEEVKSEEEFAPKEEEAPKPKRRKRQTEAQTSNAESSLKEPKEAKHSGQTCPHCRLTFPPGELAQHKEKCTERPQDSGEEDAGPAEDDSAEVGGDDFLGTSAAAKEGAAKEEAEETNVSSPEKLLKSRKVRKHKLVTEEELTFHCEHCSFRTYKESYLKDHTRVRHPNELLACPHCDQKFPRIEVYKHKKHCSQRHQQKSADGPSKELFPCKYCAFVGTKERYLLLHTRKDHPNEPFPCTFCQEEFPRLEIFKHQASCRQQNQVVSQVLEKDGQVRTVKVALDEDKALPCPEPDCDFSAQSAEAWTTHLSEAHDYSVSSPSKPEPIICEKCGRSFSHNYSLKRHDLFYHSKNKDHKCDLCAYEGKTQHSLNSHYRHIHGRNLDGTPYERQFPCPDCDFRAVNRCQLRIHQTKHASGGGAVFACDQCAYSTNRKDSLQKHVRHMHTTNRPAWVCRVCNKIFMSAAGHREHCLRHLNKKPYRCQQCDQDFLRLEEYRRHNFKVHLNAKPYLCHVCDFSCIKAHTLRRHLRAKHHMTDVRVPVNERGPKMGQSYLRHRSKDFEKVNEFLAKNTLETTVMTVMESEALKDFEQEGIITETVATEEAVADSEMQEASQILVEIGQAGDASVEVASAANLLELNGETIVYYTHE